MTTIGKWIRPLRESLNLGRANFARLCGIKKDALIKIELEKQRPTAQLLEGIGREWPQFSYWLITGNTILESGQISPEVEETRIKLKQGSAA